MEKPATDAKFGKPPERAGRKAIGTKVFYCCDRAKNAMLAWPLIMKGKLPETAGRKAMGTKASI